MAMDSKLDGIVEQITLLNWILGDYDEGKTPERYEDRKK